MMIHRWAEVKLSTWGATIGFDLSRVPTVWTYQAVDADAANDGALWLRRDDKSEVYCHVDLFDGLSDAYKRWYALRASAEGAFGAWEDTDPILFTMLHRRGKEVALGFMVVGGDDALAHLGTPEPPDWWDCPWPRPLYPSAYDYLLDP